ncbi:ubiquinone/menaquinone biosynthesis methyltransferase [Gemmatimonadota bacterium]
MTDKRGESAPRQPLKRMFDSVPDRYDLLNRILTLRMDERWRKRAARMCLECGPSRILDLCCGTGDLALHICRLADGPLEVVGLDYSAGMLETAGKKARRSNSTVPLNFVEGDAGSMEFPDGYFDVVGIAFAFRNLTWKNPLKDAALAEVRRVLRPGGRFVIVETSQPRNRLLRIGFHVYLTTAVATLGGLISGHGGAYRYLAESARRFYDAAEVSAMLSEAGLETTALITLLGGAAAIHVVTKPKET